MSIARTIIQQITALDPWALPAFGSSNFLEIPESDYYAGGLMFSVKGLTFQGNVFIFLKWSDEYMIVFMSDGIKVKEYDNVYCDMLVDILNYIEFGDKSINF
jgi:hypothetical protein